jgi:hypothetical protein
MTALATRLRTFGALGPANALRVLGYRLGLKLGIHPAQRIAAVMSGGRYFEPPSAAPLDISAPTLWRHEALLFGAHPLKIGSTPPAWTVDPLADGNAGDPPPDTLAPWWRIGDFAAGDVKRIWELSRYDWAMAFAQQARNGEQGALERLNDWMGDWAERNPPYRGPNWKCAQEASIRVLHLSVAAMILGNEHQLSAPLHAMLDAHVRRILPTLSYAQAQENNHATSEAAALFVAGAWLSMAGRAEGEALANKGRRLLERHVRRLFAVDGSFSQYSLNYHRVALDTIAIAEIWRRRAGLAAFSDTFRQRAVAATDWLRIMVDPASGDAPNLGANDGANLLQLTDAPYRDHRPSVQIATALFREARAFAAGPWDQALTWLGIAPQPEQLPLPPLAVFDDGGYCVLRSGAAMALLRYPRFRFRPSQADALHVDLWVEGRNLLRDGGSFSYNTDPATIDYFGGVESHNTIQFDAQPQMPRLSRFLLGDWLSTETCGAMDLAGGQAFRAKYRHRRGWEHDREVHLDTRLKVIDRISGFEREAKLRWRLAPGEWRCEGSSVTNGRDRLEISADVPITSITLVVGQESRRYFEKTPLPVLEVIVKKPGTITSEYRWSL